MNKAFRLICFVTVLTACHACNTRLIVVYGYDNDYHKLNDSMKALVHPLTSFDSLEVGRVYMINPELLKAELAHHPKSLVRLYSKGCNFPTCQQNPFCEQFADENGYRLFLIMTSYDALEQSIKQNPTHPLFVIDNDYYKENRRFIYERYFLNDLVGYPTRTRYKDIPEKYVKASLFMYEYDKFVDVLDVLP